MAATLAAAAAAGLERRLDGLVLQAGTCTLMPEQEVGPYYVAGELLRSDLAESHPGIPLELRIALQDSRTCAPLGSAAVDVWHCDAMGVYSGFVEQSRAADRGGPGGPGGRGRGGPPPFGPGRGGPPPGGEMGPPQNRPTDQETFCRGIQITGADGVATFRTILPGFYMGRTNHIHFKVRLAGQAADRTYEAGHTSHVGQIFFPEDLCASLMELEPYRTHAIHRTTQAEDGIYQEQHGDLSIARLRAIAGTDYAKGMRASLVAAVDPDATPAPAGRGSPGRGRG